MTDALQMYEASWKESEHSKGVDEIKLYFITQVYRFHAEKQQQKTTTNLALMTNAATLNTANQNTNNCGKI